ncbi:MAG: hypothetical protein IRZ14_06910 [Chloroflexi bacterium]|nr:hypothetical protein [Chloroflexota bacterium]
MEGPSQPQSMTAGGEMTARTLTRLQQELADTRAALQTEAVRLGQLQETLETALQVARSVRLDPHTQLDRLAEELLEAARAEAEQIRREVEEEAGARRAALEEELRARRAEVDSELVELRARTERELEARRAAVEAELSEQRSAFERQVQAAQQEFDRIAALLASATQALTASRLVAFVGGPSAAAAPPVPPAAPAPPAPAEGVAAPPSEPPAVPASEHPAAPRPTEPPAVPGPLERPEPAAPAPGLAPVAAPSAPSPTYEAACRLLDQGDVSGALDAFRAIVDREPEHVEPVIRRLASLLQDTALRPFHEEIRLLLVDAYMVQGDYDRAMSLLHEPGA